MRRMGIEEKLGVNKFLVDDDEAHIIIDKETCTRCSRKPCTFVCPAGLYSVNDDGEMKFDYAGCLECGTCRVACPSPHTMKWNYPRGTFGVEYRYS